MLFMKIKVINLESLHVFMWISVRIFAVTLIRKWLLQLPQSFAHLSHSCKVAKNPSEMYNAQVVKISLIKRYFYERV